MSWFVYIVETTTGKFYTGISTDVERRFQEHLSGNKGAKYFRSNIPKEIIYIEEYENRSMASKREYQIKKMTKAQKVELTQSSIGPS